MHNFTWKVEKTYLTLFMYGQLHLIFLGRVRTGTIQIKIQPQFIIQKYK
jgi:hypothetical protein